MKLVNKISLWFIGIVFLTTPLCMYISYGNIKKTIDNSEVLRMRDVNDKVANQLRNGERPDRYTQGRPIEINAIAGPLPQKQFSVNEAGYYQSDLQRKECRLTVSSFYNVNGINYKISSYNYVTKADQILRGMKNGILAKMLMIVIIVSITAGILSKRIFRPFRQTMEAIRRFNITQKNELQLPRSSTREFQELNKFLQKMMDKAKEDYNSVKEFSENASHELQTPLAVIRSKLELLAETDIDGNQADMILDMQNAIDKLSRINRSLAFLTKLENQEFEVEEPIKFCTITKEALVTYEDWICIKNLKVTSNLDSNIRLKIHQNLGEMLITNLVSNAIRHNLEGGSIDMKLTQQYFSISNTGLPPDMPTDELFQRFKKTNQCAESIGLGLAIVKQICEVSGFDITYEYLDGRHKIKVLFDKKHVMSKKEIYQYQEEAIIS